ncbi:MAG: DUF1992 domain-containing protein [Rhodobacterales bacterium]|mgnify:CR=1 FL=1|nr:DUF1992 domain-containing protein [Rhodobacterales bacterium]MDX5414167.1 DUF1992 domain-containing protein [Rhodobacterales bacterium]
MSWLDRIVERQIQKARLKGQLQGLKGEGAALPERPEAAFVSPALAAGYRIMAEAGVLPEEITLKKQVAAQQAALTMITEPAARKAAMARLADLQMRQSIAEEARRRFMKD